MVLRFRDPGKPKQTWFLLPTLAGAACWTKPSVKEDEVSGIGSSRYYGSTCGGRGGAEMSD